MFYAIFHHIQRHDQFAVEQMAREVAQPASDLDNPLAQLPGGHARLPLEVARGELHALLVGDRVFGGGGGLTLHSSARTLAPSRMRLPSASRCGETGAASR